ncbi:Nitroreductase family [human gut metagenome]|uniref:Nitroreductase family n=1 Tax=human gut metagenome TaxID=408170 RepID=K1SDR3_9ZZZZ
MPADHVRYLCGQDAAGYAENVNLYTAGHGLRSITRGSAPESELLAALGLDSDRYFLALAQTVGR